MPPQLKTGTVWLVGPAGPPRMLGGTVGGVEVRSVNLSLVSGSVPRLCTDQDRVASSGRSTADTTLKGPLPDPGGRASVATTPTPSTTTL